MTNDYIRREDAKIGLSKTFGRLNADIANCVIDKVEPADVAPVVHSQWEYKCGEIRCPECGNRIHRIDQSGWMNFCPNCGAKMDGEE